MIPQGLGILTAVFDDDERPAAFGSFGPVMGLSAVVGPVLAGALVSLDPTGIGWRLVFCVNLPIGLAVVAGAWRWMPRDTPDPAVRLDWIGAALVAAGCGLLVQPLIQGPESGWPAWSFALLAAAVVAFAGFARRQRRAAAPIVVPSLLRSRTYVAGLATVVVFTSGMGGLLLTYSLHVQLDRHVSPGSLEAVQQIGTALGVAVLGTVYLSSAAHGAGATGLAVAALVVAVLALPAAACVRALPAGDTTDAPDDDHVRPQEVPA